MVDKSYGPLVLFKKVVTADRQDAAGYQEIYSAGTVAFRSTDVPGIASATYKLRITVDTVLQAIDIALLSTDNFAGIATKIQAALRASTGSTETVQIVIGKIRVTSATLGATGSSISIADGATVGLLAALNAVTGGKYVCTMATAVPGREGLVTIQVVDTPPTLSNFYFQGFCVDSGGKEKVGLKYSFSKTTGLVTIADDADVVEVLNGDVITIVGNFNK
jgi:hypothetical protein